MRAQTFNQLFKLRPNCPCGSPLFTLVSRGNAMDDEYTFVNFTGSHHWTDNTEGVAFLGTIGSNVTPYGQADFMIKCTVDSPSFELLSVYEKQSPNTGMSADQFVKRHFTRDFQTNLKIFIKRECSNRGECKCSYSLSTHPITFDMSSMTLNEMELQEENFHLDDNSGRRYYFKTNFTDNLTSVRFITPSQRFIIGEQDTMEMEAEKFLRYPLEGEFLLNKVKTFLLFS